MASSCCPLDGSQHEEEPKTHGCTSCSVSRRRQQRCMATVSAQCLRDDSRGNVSPMFALTVCVDSKPRISCVAVSPRRVLFERIGVIWECPPRLRPVRRSLASFIITGSCTLPPSPVPSDGGQLLPESVAWYSRRGNLGVAWAVAWRCLALPEVLPGYLKLKITEVQSGRKKEKNKSIMLPGSAAGMTQKFFKTSCLTALPTHKFETWLCPLSSAT